MEELLARHRKEQKDLISQITGLKKQASKKTRKAVNTKCADLQSSLDARHKDEISELGVSSDSTRRDEISQEFSPEKLLAAMNLNSTADNGTSNSETSPSVAAIGEQNPGKKRNRAKERLAKRQAQIDAMKAEAEAEAANSVDYRAIEADSMCQLLQSQGLQLYEIKPDGHCLFRSIEDQLKLRHIPEIDDQDTDYTDVSVQGLRRQAAQRIRADPDSYIPYLFDQETMSLRNIGPYTTELEETAMWGSDLELAALATIYDCPIKVLVAGSAPIIFNEAGARPQLIVAYFKHSYGLGEHYNSCRDFNPDVRVD